jgi:hypothetical protein
MKSGNAVDVDVDLAGRIAAELDRLQRERPPVPMEWLTPTEAAQYLRLKPRALEQMRSEGRGPRNAKYGTRVVRYRRKWLDEFLLKVAGK